MALLPNAPFTQIDSARVAVDAPLSTDLITDIVVNENFLRANQSAKRMTSITASGSFVVPLDVNNIVVDAQAPGGGGGSGQGNIGSGFAGNGGGAGAYVRASLPVNPGETLTAVIGAAGVGGAAVSGTNGNNGTNAGPITLTGSFGTLTVQGGFGGGGGGVGGGSGGGSATGSASIFALSGVAGGGGAALGTGGAGGNSFFSQGTAAGGPTNGSGAGGAGAAGKGYGGGGGGGGSVNDASASGAGGNGSPGVFNLLY